MMSSLLFVLIALRAMIDLVAWVLMGRLALRLLAGRAGQDNAVLGLFDAFLNPPRALLIKLMPHESLLVRDGLLFLLLVSLWLALGVGKWWLLA